MDSAKTRKTPLTVVRVLADIAPWHLHQMHIIIIITWASLQVMMYELCVSHRVSSYSWFNFADISPRCSPHWLLNPSKWLLLISLQRNVSSMPMVIAYTGYATVMYHNWYGVVNLHVVDNRAYTFTEMQRAFWWIGSDRQGVRIAHRTGILVSR